MSSPSISKRNPDLGYLRITTKELGSGQDLAVSHDGLLTPISANCEKRRPSITSCSWSFLSQSTSTRSHSSSLDSAGREPCTPPNHGFVDDWQIINSDTTHLNDRKDNILDSPFQRTNSSSTMDLTSDRSWWLPRRNDQEIVRHSQPKDSDMNSATDMSIALNLGLDHKMEQPSPEYQTYTRSWSNTALMTPMPTSSPYRGYDYNPNVSVHGMALQLLSPSPWQSMSQHSSVDVATIIPSQTMVDVPSTLCEDTITDFEPPNTTEHDLWSSPSFHPIKQEFDPNDLNLHRGIEMSDHSPCSPYSSFGYTSSGPMRLPRRPKRTASRHKSKSLSDSDNYDSKYSPFNRRDLDSPSVHTSAKYKCNEPGCSSKFQRVEHLRRHQVIHDNSGPEHKCPACLRSFRARADNLRAHFKTHLIQHSASRSTRFEFEEFYRLIRDYPEISGEQAEKYIVWLETWRADGGHLKTENGNGTNRSRRSG